jgi:hypothetical protein
VNKLHRWCFGSSGPFAGDKGGGHRGLSQPISPVFIMPNADWYTHPSPCLPRSPSTRLPTRLTASPQIVFNAFCSALSVTHRTQCSRRSRPSPSNDDTQCIARRPNPRLATASPRCSHPQRGLFRALDNPTSRRRSLPRFASPVSC